MNNDLGSNVIAAGIFSLVIVLVCIAAIVGAWNG